MRATRLVDCNPKWVENSGGVVCAVRFDCPEGHSECIHVIPFTPALDGSDGVSAFHCSSVGVTWQRTGSDFATLSLSPSIRRIQRYASKDAAIAAGVLEEYFTESLTCALHIFIREGRFEFCDDSR